MLQTITQALQDASSRPVALPLAFALGLVSAMASACCTLPAMGMLVAYSGTRESDSRCTAVSSSIWFLVGTTLALIIFGLVAGMVGQAAQVFLGRYLENICRGGGGCTWTGHLENAPGPPSSMDAQPFFENGQHHIRSGAWRFVSWRRCGGQLAAL